MERRHAALPLIRDTAILEADTDRDEFAPCYTEEALKYLESDDQPFFTYVATPIHMIRHVVEGVQRTLPVRLLRRSLHITDTKLLLAVEIDRMEISCSGS
jgi:hypothetical protein